MNPTITSITDMPTSRRKNDTLEFAIISLFLSFSDIIDARHIYWMIVACIGRSVIDMEN